MSSHDQIETDVVVVGAGCAGLAAANAAAAAGCRVLVLESETAAGGTTAKSSGGFLVPNNRHLRAAGTAESREATLSLMARVSFPDLYDPDAERHGIAERDYELIETFYDNASAIIEELEADGTLATAPMQSLVGDPRGFPSYHTHLPEETITYGRTLSPVNPDGIQGYGRELIRQLLHGAERKGARVLPGHRVTELLCDGEEVIGVASDGPHGPRTVLARRGVVFAAGGFTHNRELMDVHMPGWVPGGGAVSSCRGDLVSVTAELDVELAHMDRAWWAEVPAEFALDSPEAPALLFSPYGESMLYVDRDGRRVVNEKQVYDRRARVHFVTDEHGEQPNKLLFMLYDEAVATEPTALSPTRWPVPPAGMPAPWVIEASTLGELEAELRQRLDRIAAATGGVQLAADFAANLEQAVSRFNRFAETGRDEDFGRGEDPIDVDISGPRRPGNHPNSTMYPLSPVGPYYCIIVAAATLDTKGGPRTDTAGRVLRTDGSPVPRLYGAGNCVASPSADGYWAGGATIGLAITFGYLAGRAVSGELPRAASTEAVAVSA